ncbi:MAG: hypothetical protein F4X56_01605 [Gammaproteobacteria bacterium]|nr:hypothetical protein [Gammaproteobacteria bacterium]
MTNTKRTLGQFFTVSQNPFKLTAFKQWAEEANLLNKEVLEPFAGANHIIESLQATGLCNAFASYDITPAHSIVVQRDTIEFFPTGYNVCVTNPPWLARNSATRRKLPYPACDYDDVYKYCLELCLKHCEFVAALIPASFLQSGLFQERLSTYILLHRLIFTETENPVCLALFTGSRDRPTKVFYDEEFIGELDALRANIPQETTNRRLRFNDPQGTLGFISFDNTRCRTIRFCSVAEISDYEIKESSRFVTRISGDFHGIPDLVERLNSKLTKFRDDTRDLFLTPFKGIREDGQYRRRMFFSQARMLINTI